MYSTKFARGLWTTTEWHEYDNADEGYCHISLDCSTEVDNQEVFINVANRRFVYPRGYKACELEDEICSIQYNHCIAADIFEQMRFIDNFANHYGHPLYKLNLSNEMIIDKCEVFALTKGRKYKCQKHSWYEDAEAIKYYTSYPNEKEKEQRDDILLKAIDICMYRKYIKEAK